jgi:cytochrome c-type biogenesis protein CcmE
MIRPKRGRLALSVIVVSTATVLVTAGLRGTLSYYQTPAELLSSARGEQHSSTRLGGTVVPGSVRISADHARFQLAAGGRQLTVTADGIPPQTFREGQDAVVEGHLGTDQVFHASQVLVRHGNDYRPAQAGAHQ